MISPPLLLLVSALASASGGEGCPTMDQLREAWATLPSSAGAPLPAFVSGARVAREPRGARLELLDAQEHVLAVLLLPADAPCADLAYAGALAVEARRNEVSIDRPAPKLAARPPPPVDESSSLSLEVDAALAGSWAAGLAPGGEVGISFGLSRSSLRGGIELYGVAPRGLAVGSGHARWYGFAAELGLAYRLTFAWLSVEGHAGPALSVLRVEGQGFTDDFARTGTTAALAAGLRARFSSSRLAPTFGVGLLWWPGAQRVTVTGVAASAVLPRVEVVATVGGSLRVL